MTARPQLYHFCCYDGRDHCRSTNYRTFPLYGAQRDSATPEFLSKRHKASGQRPRGIVVSLSEQEEPGYFARGGPTRQGGKVEADSPADSREANCFGHRRHAVCREMELLGGAPVAALAAAE